MNLSENFYEQKLDVNIWLNNKKFGLPIGCYLPWKLRIRQNQVVFSTNFCHTSYLLIHRSKVFTCQITVSPLLCKKEKRKRKLPIIFRHIFPLFPLFIVFLSFKGKTETKLNVERQTNDILIIYSENRHLSYECHDSENILI